MTVIPKDKKKSLAEHFLETLSLHDVAIYLVGTIVVKSVRGASEDVLI